MKLGLSQSVRLEQRLLQSPQMIQAMQILQLSALDLQERIQAELVENPFLEIAEPGESEVDGAEGQDGAARVDEPVATTAPAAEAELERAQRIEREAREDVEERGVETMLDELERYERDFDGGPRLRASGEDDGEYFPTAHCCGGSSPSSTAGAEDSGIRPGCTPTG